MAQLFFKYGTMNSGKSIELLKTAHNYEEQGKKVMVLTSALDNRSGVGKVTSRIGLERNAVAIYHDDDIFDVIDDVSNINCILVDEAQFLTVQQVTDLATIVDTRQVPIICFGLKSDFQGKLFEGSQALFELADKLEEIKTVCQWCNRKATMNLRTANGLPVYDGAQVQIGDQEYLSVCRHHYLSPKIN